MSHNKKFKPTPLFIGEFRLAKNKKHLHMKQLSKISLALFIVAAVFLAPGCAASKKSTCGCEGFVGYGNR